MTPIYVTTPHIPSQKKLRTYLDRANDSKWLTNFGPLQEELTDRLRAFLNTKNILLVNSGASAQKVIYRILNLKGDVLTTPFTFVGSVTPLLLEGHPVDFCDISPLDLNISVNEIGKTRNASHKSIMPVHVFGVPCDMEGIEKAAGKIPVIVDASHAFGAEKNGTSIVTQGDASFVSLHATKVFATIEGGILYFKDEALIEEAREFINFGFNREKQAVRIGDNYKLSEYHAAFGLAQLDEWPEYIQKRQECFMFYLEHLPNYIKPLLSTYKSNFAYYPLLLPTESVLIKVLESLALKGIFPRRYFHPSLNKLEFIPSKKGFPVSEDIASRIICLPLSSSPDFKRLGQMVETIKRFLDVSI